MTKVQRLKPNVVCPKTLLAEVMETSDNIQDIYIVVKTKCGGFIKYNTSLPFDTLSAIASITLATSTDSWRQSVTR